MNNPIQDPSLPSTRPGYWLRAIEFRKHQLGREYRATLHDKSREDISDEDYATTMATLEKMALNLGWDQSQRQDAPFGRGFGPGGRRRSGRAGFGPDARFQEHRGHDHHNHSAHDDAENALSETNTAHPDGTEA